MAKEMQTPGELMKAITAFRESRIILTGFELGVFTVLGEGRNSSRRVAEHLRADPRGIDRLMNALCALGLLRKAEGLFSNSRFSSRFLVKGRPDYLAGLAHTANLWERWGTLTGAVRRGRAVVGGRRLPSVAAERKRTRGFIAAMHQRGSVQAAAVAKLLDLSSVRRTLDVGAGSGAYSIALVQATKNVTAAAFDLSDVIPLTRSYVREAGLTSRFKFIEGDFKKDPFGSGYDLILLSAIIHMNSPAENVALIRKCANALSPGGRLVIQDWVMSSDRTRPAAGALFALNMLVGTAAGDTFTESEIKGWMRTAGLTEIRRRQTPFETSLMIGKKR